MRSRWHRRHDRRMDAGEMRAYCLGKPGAWANQPWEDDQVAKVGPKIFAFMGDETVMVKSGATRDETDARIASYPVDARVAPYCGRSGCTVLRLGDVIPDDELTDAV